MDSVRLGLSIRALRRRLGWTQEALAKRAGVSRAAISRVERGGATRVSLALLDRLAQPLAARVDVRILWQGEELDRLLDRDHAALVEWTIDRLQRAGWTAVPEVTFRIGTERGSIDVFAHHPATGSILVVEVKSVVPDVQATIAGIDRKSRLAGLIARERGWRPGPVSRLLVLPNDRTARRRLEHFAATFDRAFPARTVAVRRWLARPAEPISGVLFVSDVTHAGARHRVRRAPGQIVRGSRVNS